MFGGNKMKRLLWPMAMILLVAAGCLAAPPTINQPPTAYIDSVYPINSVCGETVTFRGHGIDPDGTIGAYNWRSSRDGQLSTAENFETSSLSPGTHTIWFKVQDDDGEWSNEDQASLVVVASGAAKPVISSFSASPVNINLGGSSTLSWDVSGCTTVNIDQGIGNVALSGTRVVSPTKTTTYTLTSINEVGISTATAQVVVNEMPLNRLELYPVAAESGQVRWDGYISQQPLIGDAASGKTIQAFFSFDISMIPKGTTITSASLDLATSDLFGSPFEVLGRLYIYQCRYTQLRSSDFASGMALPGAIYITAVLPNDAISSNMLVNAIQTNVNEGSSRFQIRLQFEKQQIYRASTPSTYNNLADYITFDPARTKLTIEYQY
jgi:hypothetical protein